MAIPGVAIAAGAAAGVGVIGAANAEKFKDVAPGEVHNEGRNRRKAFHESLRAETRGVRAEIEALGPAGASAGGAVAGGIEAGLERMKAAVKAAVREMQGDLNSLRAPSIGRGPGGFDTGKQGPN